MRLVRGRGPPIELIVVSGWTKFRTVQEFVDEPEDEKRKQAMGATFLNVAKLQHG